MKTYKLMNSGFLKLMSAALAIVSLSVISGCDDDDPKKEDTPELVTKATLTFTPAAGGTAVVVNATDPDNEGVQELKVDGPINLAANTSYTLSITMVNELADPSEEEYDITAEVEEEGDEHQLFFAWTNNVFNNPTGNGNIDNGGDQVNYEDEDGNGRPIGLESFWTSGAASSGTFRVLLKHQPDLKSDTSDSSIGETDLDLTFAISVQ
jgi:hypothetical protein